MSAPISFSCSILLTVGIAVQVVVSAAIAIAVSNVFSAIVTLSTSIPLGTASAIFSLLPVHSHCSGVLVRRLSAVLVILAVGSMVRMVLPACCVFLLCGATLVASCFRVHLLLNMM